MTDINNDVKIDILEEEEGEKAETQGDAQTNAQADTQGDVQTDSQGDKKSIIRFDDIINLTNNAREENSKLYYEKCQLAIEEFILYLDPEFIKDKMKKSAKSGFNRVNIYVFKWCDDKTSEYDEDNNKIIYGDNIRLSNLVTKGKNNFINELNKYFNGDGENKFRCGVFIQYRSETNLCHKYHIYVSWGNKENYSKSSKKEKFVPGYRRNESI